MLDIATLLGIEESSLSNTSIQKKRVESSEAICSSSDALVCASVSIFR